MKLALVVAFAPDRRSGRVLGNVVPADEAVKTVKEAISAESIPDARYPILAAVALTEVLRDHRFKPTPEAIKMAEDVGDEGVPMIRLEDLIYVGLGDGDQAVSITVTTEEEAAFVRELAESATKAGGEIERLRGELQAARQQAEGMAAANQRLATYEAEIRTAQEKAAQDAAKIAELEAKIGQQASTTAAPSHVASTAPPKKK